MNPVLFWCVAAILLLPVLGCAVFLIYVYLWHGGPDD